MTITPSMSSHRLMVAFARLDIERYAKDPSREQVAVLLPLWCGYDGMTDDERAEVLASYPLADPEPVPSVDYLPMLEQATADAAVIVAEVVGSRRWRDRDSDIWVESSRGPDSVQRVLPDGSLDPRFPYREDVERHYGPLVEVIADDCGCRPNKAGLHLKTCPVWVNVGPDLRNRKYVHRSEVTDAPKAV